MRRKKYLIIIITTAMRIPLMLEWQKISIEVEHPSSASIAYISLSFYLFSYLLANFLECEKFSCNFFSLSIEDKREKKGGMSVNENL